MIDRVQWSGTCAGADSSAAVTAYSPHVAGKVLAVAVTYAGDKPSTTHVTISDEGDPLSESIASIIDTATDVKIYPRRVTEKNDGTDILYVSGEEVFEPYVVFGRLEMVVATANLDDVITATVWIEE